MAEWMQALLGLGAIATLTVTASHGKVIVWKLQRDGNYFIK